MEVGIEELAAVAEVLLLLLLLHAATYCCCCYCYCYLAVSAEVFADAALIITSSIYTHSL
jgi:hypothetical protein